MSNIIPLEQQVPAFAMARDELIHTLQNSVYPGAKKESVELVLGYCQAQRLDPLQKPVHIVPMWDKNLNAMRDVIMPGIGLYRVQSSRTDAHAGTTEPAFGPMVTRKWGNFELEFPEWCKVTVSRVVGGQVYHFVAIEYWLENYATAGKDTTVPNAMWKKRPRGQLAKCAEAQALRKAFPELGAAPTAEEMEGKAFELDDAGAPATNTREPNEFMPSARRESTKPTGAIDVDPDTGEAQQGTAGAPATDAPPATSGKAPATDGEVASAGMIATLRKTMERKGKSENDFAEKFGVSLDQMPNAIRNEAMAWARA